MFNGITMFDALMDMGVSNKTKDTVLRGESLANLFSCLMVLWKWLYHNTKEQLPL